MSESIGSGRIAPAPEGAAISFQATERFTYFSVVQKLEKILILGQKPLG
jgi:hypothetical protein